MTDICAVSSKTCRHLSQNFSVVRIPKFKVVGTLKIPDGEQAEIRPDERGGFCNDGGKYVSDIKGCQNVPPSASFDQTPLTGERGSINVVSGVMDSHRTKQSGIEEWI